MRPLASSCNSGRRTCSPPVPRRRVCSCCWRAMSWLSNSVARSRMSDLLVSITAVVMVQIYIKSHSSPQIIRLFNNEPDFGCVTAFEEMFQVISEALLELGGRGRAAVGEEDSLQVIQADRQLGQAGQRLLDGGEEFLGNVVRQLLRRHEIL